MYSRDIFPKYTSGGLPIPENYSGNAIRREPQGGVLSGDRAGGGQSVSPSSPSRVHTPRTNGARSASGGVRVAEAPLTVTPSFAAAQSGRREEEREREERTEDALRGSAPGNDPPQEVPSEANDADDGRRGEDSRRETDRREVGGSGEGSPIGREDTRGREEPAAAASAHGHAPRHEGGLGSLLSAFLPPKFGGGALSQVGLEEALLLGLFLLLSQSEEEDDTLLLLALLFLYR